MAGLKLNGVNKVYPSGTLALYDINFETNEKEFIVVLGGEASGKSTLLRVISGLEDASAGEIFIGGKDVTNVEPKDRELAMIKSNTLYPTLNVFDNLAFGLKVRKAPQTLIEQRVKAVANILGLNDVLYRKPKSLTAAQKQRVTIGRAVVREPKLYLFDEPLSGLDSKLKEELLNIIINMQARMEGTFVYTTKNVAEAMSIGTRIIVLKNGLVQQIDTPANLYDYPANAYVAFYIGAPTINFVNNAKIVKDENGISAVRGEFSVPIPDSVINRFKEIDGYVNTGKQVIVGIRPEDAETGAEGIEGKIGKVESDGGKVYAEFTSNGQTLVVGTQEGVKTGEVKKLKINTDRLYIFDGETRLTLLGRDGGYVNTGFADADFVPLPFNDEEDVKNKFKHKKDSKKKK